MTTLRQWQRGMTIVNLPRIMLMLALIGAGGVWLTFPVGRFAVTLVLLLLTPGYLLDRYLLREAPRSLLTRVALWPALSISAVAILYEWCNIVRVPLTVPVWYVLMLLCVLAAFSNLWRELSTPAFASPESLHAHTRYAFWYALALVSILTLIMRFVQISELALPPWVDSVHHALLIQVTAEQGHAPSSLRPYLPVDNLPYHWGYHVFIAVVFQLSGLPLPEVMLWSGQVLNALHVVTCAALAVVLWRHPLAGVVAALVVGLWSIMPAYYISWGRYTQLTGLLLLPPLAIAWHTWLRVPSWRWLPVMVLLLTGLMLVHVRVVIFAACLLTVMGVVWAAGQPWHIIKARLVPVLLLGASVGILSLPWLGTIFMRILLPVVEAPQTLVGSESYNRFSDQLLWSGQSNWLIPAALIGALWGLWRRSAAPLLMLGWIVAMLLLANPRLTILLVPAIGLILLLWAGVHRRLSIILISIVLLLFNPLLVQPSASWMINNDSIIITLFIPISVLVGGLIVRLWNSRAALALRWRGLLRGSMVLVLTLLALAGAWDMRSVINWTTVFATPADRAALDWAAEHTPADARFLINARPWMPISNRGTDGGWWLLPLTGRWTSTPPVLYAYGAPDYVQQVQERSNLVAGFQPGQEQAIYDLIERDNITHIYLGINSDPLPPDMFADRAKYELIYEVDGVTILALDPES
jgi:hypothetical protein